MSAATIQYNYNDPFESFNKIGVNVTGVNVQASIKTNILAKVTDKRVRSEINTCISLVVMYLHIIVTEQRVPVVHSGSCKQLR